MEMPTLGRLLLLISAGGALGHLLSRKGKRRQRRREEKNGLQPSATSVRADSGRREREGERERRSFFCFTAFVLGSSVV